MNHKIHPSTSHGIGCCALQDTVDGPHIALPDTAARELLAHVSSQDGFFKQVLDHLADGVYIVDRVRRIFYWNPSCRRITGYDALEVLERHCQDGLLMHTDQQGVLLCQNGCPLALTLQDGELREADVYLRHKNGVRIPVRVRIAPLYSSEGAIVGAVETFSDNSSKIQAIQLAQEYEAMAFLDPLTGVGNRRFADTKLEEMFERYRATGMKFGVIFLDLDHFKRVNDQFGHDAGDAVLRTVAGTMANALRNFDFVARWGGEEFIAIVQAPSLSDVAAIAERCRALIAATPIAWHSHQLVITASFGVTSVRPEDTLQALINRADFLLYQSKANGRNRVTAD